MVVVVVVVMEEMLWSMELHAVVGICHGRCMGCSAAVKTTDAVLCSGSAAQQK